jgi:hypothetical protein
MNIAIAAAAMTAVTAQPSASFQGAATKSVALPRLPKARYSEPSVPIVRSDPPCLSLPEIRSDSIHDGGRRGWALQ